MKKLSILLIAIVFMWAGNAFAQGNPPTCGIWVGGPSTWNLTAGTDFGFRTGETPANNMIIQGNCGMPYVPYTYKMNVSPDACQSHAIIGPRGQELRGYAVEYPDAAISGSGTLYYQVEHNIRSENPAPGNIGTINFYDPQGLPPSLWPMYTADVILNDIQILPMFANLASWSSQPAPDCTWDSTSTLPPSTTAAAAMRFHLDVRGEVQGASEYTEVRFKCEGIMDGITGGTATVLYVQGHTQNMRVEIQKPLRGDLNGDGVVTFADYGLFAGDWGKGDACGCANYFPGQHLP